METINLDTRWTKLMLSLAILFSLSLMILILSMAGCGAEIRPIQNHQPATCCSAKSCERMHHD